jgi:hypothetical protein
MASLSFAPQGTWKEGDMAKKSKKGKKKGKKK